MSIPAATSKFLKIEKFTSQNFEFNSSHSAISKTPHDFKEYFLLFSCSETIKNEPTNPGGKPFTSNTDPPKTSLFRRKYHYTPQLLPRSPPGNVARIWFLLLLLLLLQKSLTGIKTNEPLGYLAASLLDCFAVWLLN